MPKELTSKDIYNMLYNGGNVLKAKVHDIDALNVFPVPDGDTGTNMNLSYQAGIQEMQVNSKLDTASDVMAAFARGIMMGARGNSGVILSQLFRGMSQAIKDKEIVTADDLAASLQRGVEVAYKAVMKPVEGTILTVAKEAAITAVESAKKSTSIKDVFLAAIEQAEVTLAKTPDMLPILKEVGVVDAGGMGLIIIYKGMYQTITGEVLPEIKNIRISNKSINMENLDFTEDVHDDDCYGYCTEFIINNLDKSFSEQQARDIFSEMGDSLIVVHNDDFAKVHIHTLDPGKTLSQALMWGSLHRIKIENMTEQSENVSVGRVNTNKISKKYGIISVTNGEGIKEVFISLGVDEIVFGGQSMNPSTLDLAEAVKKVNAEIVFILPNNKNIIMAAKQVEQIVKEKKVIVIETKTIPEGITAALAFHEEFELDKNINNMTLAVGEVVSGQVTYAVRDSQINNKTIKEGDYIGIKGSEIINTSTDLIETTIDLLAEMIDENKHEIITVFCGEEITKEQINNLKLMLEERYSDFEIEIKLGKQPTYFFIISVE